MIWASVIAGIAAVLAAAIGYRNNRKIAEVHVLVDGRLSDALKEIDELKGMLKDNGPE